jgi:hypothetical protein
MDGRKEGKTRMIGCVAFAVGGLVGRVVATIHSSRKAENRMERRIENFIFGRQVLHFYILAVDVHRMGISGGTP